MKRILFFATGLITIAISCKRAYNPTAIKSQTGFLVVEGFINPGNDTTRFKLSRVVQLSTSTKSPVNNATVTIEDMSNNKFTLTGNSSGIYAALLHLNNAQKYRLHIITSDNKDYVSDFVDVKVTPAIDTIDYAVKGNGLQININSHDPANNTRYYRWDYTENWEFHSLYESTYISNGDSVIARSKDQDVYTCYTSDNSTNVLLGSSAQLAQDVISEAPITVIPSTSEKVELEYSIQVNQYALNSDAYTFWQNLKKNTEQLGSIFDAQPSELQGNIHCTTSPDEPVVGYVSASTVQSKRIFILRSALPAQWKPIYPYDCPEDSVFLHILIGRTIVNQEDQVFNYKRGGGSEIPISAINDPNKGPGHLGAGPLCVDCTLRGTVTKPSFWK